MYVNQELWCINPAFFVDDKAYASLLVYTLVLLIQSIRLKFNIDAILSAWDMGARIYGYTRLDLDNNKTCVYCFYEGTYDLLKVALAPVHVQIRMCITLLRSITHIYENIG